MAKREEKIKLLRDGGRGKGEDKKKQINKNKSRKKIGKGENRMQTGVNASLLELFMDKIFCPIIQIECLRRRGNTENNLIIIRKKRRR